MQGASRSQGPSLAKRCNTADALSRSNPQGRADSGAYFYRKPLAVNDTAARFASRRSDVALPLGTWATEANMARAHSPRAATARFAAQLRRGGRLREPSRIGLVASVKLVLTRPRKAAQARVRLRQSRGGNHPECDSMPEDCRPRNATRSPAWYSTDARGQNRLHIRRADHPA